MFTRPQQRQQQRYTTSHGRKDERNKYAPIDSGGRQRNAEDQHAALDAEE